MINHIDGRLVEISSAHAIIDCNGVGYYLHITVNTYSKIGSSEKCKLLAHVITSQQDYGQNMYGFFDEQERSTFRHLISVSGVGASTARVVLSSLSPNEVQQAIAAGNVSVFRNVKGIGEKTAQRIIIDLNGKLSPLSGGEGPGARLGGVMYNKTRDEALRALLTLGFVKNLSEKAIDKALSAKPDLLVDQVVKEALKNL